MQLLLEVNTNVKLHIETK